VVGTLIPNVTLDDGTDGAAELERGMEKLLGNDDAGGLMMEEVGGEIAAAGDGNGITAEGFDNVIGGLITWLGSGTVTLGVGSGTAVAASVARTDEGGATTLDSETGGLTVVGMGTAGVSDGIGIVRPVGTRTDAGGLVAVLGRGAAGEGVGNGT
jgi:hypothetical protein